MGAGGDAPPLRLQDVLMLVGLSLFVGSIVMLAWDDPVPLNSEEAVTGQATLGQGASVDVEYSVDQTSIVTVRFQFEDQDEVLTTEAVAAGATETIRFDMPERGAVSWSISVSEGTGEVDVDLKRGAMAFVWPPLLGALLVGYSVLLGRQNDDAPEAEAESLDAELLG
ncbi:MAG: hypothetical protein QF839_01655 [Candidatus Poseidoniaceae archaeon]|nr:hypothetical protein [Euryarchaeota archaeon]MDP6232868.1 hypothetical protein [Candidatus Poseidoniaceae archaeon]